MTESTALVPYVKKDALAIGTELHLAIAESYNKPIVNPNYRTLIICKASLVPNWYREVKKLWGDDTRIAVFSGSLPTDSDITRMITNKTFPFTIVSFNLIGKQHEIEDTKGTQTTLSNVFSVEETYKDNLWVKLINLAKFDCCIMDEVQYLNNHESGRSIGARLINTPDVIELSATPTKNKAVEMWPLLNIIDKEAFPTNGSFERDYTWDGIRPRNPELSQQLATRMIRRERSRVQKSLPPINRIPRYFDLKPKAAKVYKKALLGVYQSIDEAGNEISKNLNNILAKINKLRQIVALASAETTVELAEEIHDSYTDADKYTKVLVFSQFQPTTFGITQLLKPNSNGFIRQAKDLKGYNLISVEDRMKLVDHFMDDPNEHYLCATLFAAQEGLTITSAGACITNDLWWNHVAHEQAEGRAYGRTNDPHSIDSYYVLANNTIAIYMWELIWMKETIASDTVSGTDEGYNMQVARKLIDRLKLDMERM